MSEAKSDAASGLKKSRQRMSRRGEARRTNILVCPEPRLESGEETKNWSPEAENNGYLNLVAWFVSPQPKSHEPMAWEV
jgi:hypothetical protein